MKYFTSVGMKVYSTHSAGGFRMHRQPLYGWLSWQRNNMSRPVSDYPEMYGDLRKTQRLSRATAALKPQAIRAIYVTGLLTVLSDFKQTHTRATWTHTQNSPCTSETSVMSDTDPSQRLVFAANYSRHMLRNASPGQVV